MRAHLADSEQWRSLIATTLEQMGIAAWELDLATGELWWSDNAGPLVGRARGFTPAGFAQALTFFHQADLRSSRPEDMVEGLREGPIATDVRALLPDGSVRWLSNRIFLVGDEGGGPGRITGLMIDIDAVKRRERRQRLLTEASRMLAASLDYDTTLKRVGEILVPEWADWCSLDLLVEGRLIPAVISHHDPEKVSWARHLVESYPRPMVEDDESTRRVVVDRVPELITDITDQMLVASARDERHLEMLRRVGMRSSMRVPLVSGDRVLGVLALLTAESRVRFDAEDLDFALDLASGIATAIDNARLHAAATEAHDHAREIADRLARLQRVTAKLSQAYDTQDVANLALEEVLRAVGAQRGVLLLATDDVGLELMASPGYSPERRATWSPDVLAGTGPVGRAYRESIPIYVEDYDQLVRNFPELADLEEPPLGVSWSASPILSSSGALGVMGLTFDSQQTFPESERRMIEALVRQCAIALERSRLFEGQRRAVDVLQRGLMPEALPATGPVKLAAHYEIGGLAKVGGDWYDAFVTDEGRVALVIGDVVGRGIPAVSTMAQLRNGLKAYLMEGHSPGQALSLLNRHLARRIPVEEGLATVCCLLYDPDAERLRWARAGHLPPMLCRPPHHAAEPLWSVADIPLGVEHDYHYQESETEVEPGTLVVLYSDGLVERRDEDLQTSLDRLQALLAAAPSEPRGMLDYLVSELALRPATDDVAVLVAELLPDQPG